MVESVQQEVLNVNQRLLQAIASADWKTYEELCDPTLTCFEPEGHGSLVTGMAFHEYYFKLGPVQGLHNTTMSSPHVRLLGDVAVLSYVRLNQRVGVDGKPATVAFEETRVWHRKERGWRLVHVHRSRPNGG